MSERIAQCDMCRDKKRTRSYYPIYGGPLGHRWCNRCVVIAQKVYPDIVLPNVYVFGVREGGIDEER